MNLSLKNHFRFGGEGNVLWYTWYKNVPNQEQVLVGADLYCHIWKKEIGYSGIHGEKSFRKINDEGEAMLELTESLDLTFGNSLFQKRKKYLFTYKSGTKETQIDNF